MFNYLYGYAFRRCEVLIFKRKVETELSNRLMKVDMDAQIALEELYKYFLGEGFIVIDVGSIDQINYMIVFWIERLYKSKKDRNLFKRKESESETYERLDKVAGNKKTSMDAQTALYELLYYFIGNVMFVETETQEEINYNIVYIIEKMYKGKK